MGIAEIEARSILQKSGLPGTHYVVNAYTGCVHGCVYCYARFMKRFTGHTQAWGTFLDAKINAPQLLRQQLARRREPLTDVVFLSSVTDPYQPPEAKYGLTREVLKVLLDYQVPISILTKSDLVLRDLDLLKQFRDCRVGLSLMTVDDELAHRMEPRASSPTRRLRALKTLRDNGVYTYAFVSPFLPGLSDLDALERALDGAIDEIGVEAINMRGGNWIGVEAVLARHYPARLEECKRLAKDAAFWSDLERRTEELALRGNLNQMGFFRH